LRTKELPGSLVLWLPIGLASFFLYSSAFFPLLNSDDAINILMIKDLQLPQDWYPWGQDRGGALIPLLAWPLHHLLGLSVVWAESIIHYLILFVGFGFLSKVFHSRLSVTILAIAWFFPTYWFFGFLRFPFGVQYSLIPLALYLTFIKEYPNPTNRMSPVALILSVLLLALSLWASDLTVTCILSILLVIGYRSINERIALSQVLRSQQFYLPLGVSTLSLLLIFLAKDHAIKTEAYNQTIFNTIPQIGESISLLATNLWQILSFQKETWLLSLFGILTIVLIGALILHKPRVAGKQRYLFLFFLIDMLALLAVIVLSNWAYLNGLSRRYFSGIYIGMLILILIGIENLNSKRRIFQFLALMIALLGGYSSIHYLKLVYPKTLQPMIKVVGELKTLGDIGIVADYWNSYISACPNPYHIAAIPHEREFNRRPEQIREVFSKPKLYVIKDMWMEEFPDSLMQYGYLLKRKGDPMNLANCAISEYERVPRLQQYTVHDLITIQDQILTDSISGNTVVLADSSCHECFGKHLVYGPDTSLGHGSYQVGFYLRVDDARDGKDIAVLDVTADYGHRKLQSLVIKSEQVENDEFAYYWLDLDLEEYQKNVEFRVLYLGHSAITFHHVLLREIR